MDLQQHSRDQARLREPTVNAQHGDLDEVGSGTLYHRIDSDAFGFNHHLLASIVQTCIIADTFDPATAIEQRADVALGAAGHDGFFDELTDAWEPGKVGLDKFRSFSLGDLKALRQTKRALPIDDSKVDGFGAASLSRGDLVERHGIDFAGDLRVNVSIVEEGFTQGFIATEMREDAQFNLRIIGG